MTEADRKLRAAFDWAVARLAPTDRATALSMAETAPKSSVRPIAAQAKDTALWHTVAAVTSDADPSREYTIKRNRANNTYGCSCQAYRFSRETPKSCKHILALFGEPFVQVNEGLHERRKIVGASETFTIRRAISIGGDL